MQCNYWDFPRDFLRNGSHDAPSISIPSFFEVMAQQMRYIFALYSIKRVVLCAAVDPHVNFKLATCNGWEKVCDGWARNCDGWARNCDGWANACPCPPLDTPLSISS